MLEVQLCRRSHNGVVIPIARDDSPKMVRSVAMAILRKKARLRFNDEILDDLVKEELDSILRILENEAPDLFADWNAKSENKD